MILYAPFVWSIYDFQNEFSKGLHYKSSTYLQQAVFVGLGDETPNFVKR